MWIDSPLVSCIDMIAGMRKRPFIFFMNWPFHFYNSGYSGAEDEVGHFTFHLSQYSYEGSFHLSVGRSCGSFPDNLYIYKKIFSWLNTRFWKHERAPTCYPQDLRVELIDPRVCHPLPIFCGVLSAFVEAYLRFPSVGPWTGSFLKWEIVHCPEDLPSITFVASRMFQKFSPRVWSKYSELVSTWAA